MRLLFMGTPEFAVTVLEILLGSDHKIVGVVTQPDKPKGRHLHEEPSPVKIAGLKASLSIWEPQRLDEGLQETIASLKPDVIVVAAYGKLIPDWLLRSPRFGCLNIHPSALPKYRGAAPVQRVIMSGEKETGVTVMCMDEGLDTGAILKQEQIIIDPDETAGQLNNRLAERGAKMLLDVLKEIADGNITPRAQDEKQATYAAKIEKEETRIDWSESSQKIKDTVRALSPHPGAYALYQGMRVKVWRTTVETKGHPDDDAVSAPGAVLVADSRSGLTVATGTTPLTLLEVQPEGKKKISGAEFVRGYRLTGGNRFS